MTPYEAWFAKKPNLAHIRVFGCVGHVKVLNAYAKKLDDRSILMVHLGIEEGSKAYRMCDRITNKVHVSRDVHFEEQRKWEWKKDNSRNDQAWFSFRVVDVNTVSISPDQVASIFVKTVSRQRPVSAELIHESEIKKSNIEIWKLEVGNKLSGEQVMKRKKLEES